jgi:hypothetical protein
LIHIKRDAACANLPLDRALCLHSTIVRGRAPHALRVDARAPPEKRMPRSRGAFDVEAADAY